MTAREPEHLTRAPKPKPPRGRGPHTRRQNQMKSIAQIVQNNRRLLAAYEDKVQPRFLSRYGREPMATAADGPGARTEFHVADGGIAYVQTFAEDPDVNERVDMAVMAKMGHRVFRGSELEDLAEANGLKLGGASRAGMVYFCTLAKKTAIVEAGK